MSWQARAAAEEIGIKHNLTPTERLVLDRMAGHAGKKGEGIFPSMATLKIQTGASISSIYRAIKRFVQLGILEYGDQSLVAHIPADNRPRVYNMILAVTERLRRTFAKFGRMAGRKKPVEKPKAPVSVTPGNDESTGHSDRQTVNSLKENPAEPPADAGAAAHAAAFLAAIRARRAQRAQGLPVTEPLPLVPAVLQEASSPVGGPSSTAWE